MMEKCLKKNGWVLRKGWEGLESVLVICGVWSQQKKRCVSKKTKCVGSQKKMGGVSPPHLLMK